MNRPARTLVLAAILTFLSALPASARLGGRWLDPTFGTYGRVRIVGASDMLVQPDGKMLVLRRRHGFHLERFLRGGSLDKSFGSDGVADLPIATDIGADSLLAFAQNADILVLGADPDGGDDLHMQLAVARYLPDG